MKAVAFDPTERKAAQLVAGAIVAGAAPMYSEEGESSVLSALVGRHVAVGDVSDILTAEMFYSGLHASWYRAVLALAESGDAVDIGSISNWLSQNGNEGKAREFAAEQRGLLRDIQLGHAVPTVRQVRLKASWIRDAWVRRQLGHEAIMVEAKAYHPGDTAELLEAHAAKIEELRGMLKSGTTSVSAKTAACELGKLLTTGVQRGMGIGPRLRRLERMLMGLRRPEVTIIGARTSVGKSILAMQLAVAIAEQGFGVYVASLEMSQSVLTSRFAAHIAQVNSRFGLGPDQVTSAEMRRAVGGLEALGKLPIEIHPTQVATMADIYAGAQAFKRELGRKDKQLGLVLVDHIGLPVPPKELAAANRAVQVGNTSRKLRWMADSLGCHVLAPAQINRAGADYPTLLHLKDSGDIEQDADNVILIHRKPVEGRPNEFDDRSPAHLIVAKARVSGERGTVRANCNPAFHTFSEVEDHEEYEQ
jgi:replicative DNA helicase